MARRQPINKTPKTSETATDSGEAESQRTSVETSRQAHLAYGSVKLDFEFLEWTCSETSGILHAGCGCGEENQAESLRQKRNRETYWKTLSEVPFAYSTGFAD